MTTRRGFLGALVALAAAPAAVLVGRRRGPVTTVANLSGHLKRMYGQERITKIDMRERSITLDYVSEPYNVIALPDHVEWVREVHPGFPPSSMGILFDRRTGRRWYPHA